MKRDATVCLISLRVIDLLDSLVADKDMGGWSLSLFSRQGKDGWVVVYLSLWGYGWLGCGLSFSLGSIGGWVVVPIPFSSSLSLSLSGRLGGGLSLSLSLSL